MFNKFGFNVFSDDEKVTQSVNITLAFNDNHFSAQEVTE